MADNYVVNGVCDQRSDESATKIEALKRERDELVSKNANKKEEIKKLTAELEGLRSDGAEMREKMEELQRQVVHLEEASKAAKEIATRAADLETQVARLQHDTTGDTSDAEEARAEAAELKKVLEEKESRVEYLEQEVAGLKLKAESEVKLKELERKIAALETKEIEERNKRIRVEEEMRDKIDEKERDIQVFRQKVEEFEKAASEKKSELDQWAMEKLGLQKALRDSEERASYMESNIARLLEEAAEAQKVIESLNEKAVETINRGVNGIVRKENGLKFQWPVVAAGSTGAFAVAAAVIYLCYGKRR